MARRTDRDVAVAGPRIVGPAQLSDGNASAARRLLACFRAGMLRTFFSALAIWAISCVVPVPLQTENDLNQPPVQL